MRIEIEHTAKYYPGRQKIHILGDRTFRTTLACFGIFGAATAAGYLLFRGQAREALDLVLTLAMVIPLGWSISGRLSARGLAWYAGFAALYSAGTLPVVFGAGYAFLLPVVPALGCLYMLDREAPWVLESLGYKGKFRPLAETAPALLLPAALIIFAYHAAIMVLELEPEWPGPGRLLFLTCLHLPMYPAYIGILYGKLARRLLNLRVELVGVIAINVGLWLLIIAPVVIGREDPLFSLAGMFIQSVFVQMAFGLTYHFCRSVRPMVFGYWLYYLFYKTVIP